MPVASKLSLLELSYLCALANGQHKGKKEKDSLFERRKAGTMEEHRKEQTNEWTNACAFTHLQIKEQTCACKTK